MRLRFILAVVVSLSWTVNAQENKPAQLVFRAFGDVNLGRSVGQELLKGNVDYPFENAGWISQGADVVFVNLESQLTEQGGETQNPRDNFAFCGPPVGSVTLKNAGIGIVSTANNHAYDYGMRALQETVEYLLRDGIRYVGTSKDSVGKFSPVIFEKDGIRLSVLAYTEFVNRKGAWQGRISLFDRKRARTEIESARRFSDVVIVSYHGGTEYTEEPSKFAQAQMRYLSDIGADIVIGHHPHVPQGIEERKGRYIFYSLGNFVFYQPQHVWTQFGIGVELHVVKTEQTVTVGSLKIIPIRAGKQPSVLLSEEESERIRERLQQFSNVNINREDSYFTVHTRSHD